MQEIQNTEPKYIPLAEAGKILNTSRDYMNVLVRRGKLRAIKLGRNWVTTKEWVDEYRNGLGVLRFKDLDISEFRDSDISKITADEKTEFQNLKRGLILERERSLEAKALIPEIKVLPRELQTEERRNILEAAQKQFKTIDGESLIEASRNLGILRNLRLKSGLSPFGRSTAGRKFTAVFGLAMILLAITIGFTNFLPSGDVPQGHNISRFQNSGISKYQASILSDVFKNFPSDIPLFYRWLSDSVSQSLAFLKYKNPSELSIGELPQGVSKIIKPQEPRLAGPRVDTYEEALALDEFGPGEETPQLAEGEPRLAGPLGGVSNSEFTVIENRLSVVEADLAEQKAVTNSELSLQKKTILGTLETLIGVSKLLPTYPISTIVVQGSPATLTSYSIAPQVQTGFDRLSASYLTLSNNAEINGSLTVKSGGTFNTISVSGATILTGNATIGGALSVAGDTTLGNLTVNGTLTTPGSVTFGNASTTYLTVSNAAWLNQLSVTGTATSTFSGPITVTGNVGVATTSPTQALTIQGNEFLYGGLGVGIATTTRGAIQTSGDVFVGRNLSVSGNSAVLGGSSADTLTVNSSINSNLIPDANSTRDIGSTAKYWKNAFVSTLTVNNISAASTTIGGTQSETFTINSDNATADNETETLIFFRGTVVPNALLTWNAATSSKRFEFNQALYINNGSASTTNPTLTVQTVANQTANAFQIIDNNSSNIFSVNPVGSNTTMINASTTNATLTNFWSTNGQITNASTTNLTVSGNLFAGSSGVFMLADGTVGAPSLAFSNDTDTGIFRPGNNQMSFATGATTSLMLDNGKTIVGNAISTASYQLEVNNRDANNNTIVDETRLAHFTTGTAANGLGAGVLFYGQDSTGAGQNMARIASQVEQANPSNTFASNLSFWTVGSGGLLEKMRITGNGALGLATTTIPSGYGANIATSTNIFGKLTVGTGTIDILSGNIINNSGQFNITNAANAALTFSTNNSERMRIDNSGNVGIGTTTPSTLLYLESSSAGPQFTISGNGASNNVTQAFARIGTNKAFIGLAGGPNAIITGSILNDLAIRTDSQKILFSTDAGTTGHMVIDTSGNVGIGTTTIPAKLTIGLGRGGVANSLRLSDNATGNAVINLSNDSSGNGLIQMENVAGTVTAQIATDSGRSTYFNHGGNVGIGTTTPAKTLVVSGSSSGNIEENIDNSNSAGSAMLRFTQGGTGLGYIASCGTTAGASCTGGSGALQINNAQTAPVIFFTGGTNERARIDSSGNVGIGTTTPSTLLSLSSATNGRFMNVDIPSSGSTTITMGSLSSNFTIGQDLSGDDLIIQENRGANDSDIVFKTLGSTERMRITGAGNVGIGTTTPNNLLSISSATTPALGFTTATGFGWTVGMDTADSNKFKIASSTAVGTNTRLTIDGSGNVGIGTTNPTNAKLVVNGGGSYIGSSVAGTITPPDGAITGRAIDVTATIVPPVGADAFGIYSAPTLNKAGSGTHTQFANVYLAAPTIGAGASTLTNAATLWVNAAPTAATNNYAIYAPSGTDYFGGNVGIGTTGPNGKLNVNYTSTNPTAQTYNGAFIIDSSDAKTSLQIGVLNSGASGAWIQSYNEPATAAGNFNLLLNPLGGNVGIGTTGPTYPLDIVGSGSTQARIRSSSNGQAYLRLERPATSNDTGVIFQTGASTDWVIGALGASIGAGSDLNFYDSAGTAGSRMTIKSTTGNVGIGTTSPNRLLTVASAVDSYLKLDTTGNSASFASGVLFNTSQTTGDGDVMIRVLSNTNRLGLYTASTERVSITNAGNVGIGTTSPTQVLSVQGNILTSGCLKVKGAADTGTCVDLAESYPTSESVESGDIVMLDPNSPVHIKKATAANIVVGIVSTNPSILLNGDSTLFGGSTPLPFASSTAPVALSGRVPVKVSLEGGPIKIGDRIALSSVPGVGMAATTSGMTVGIALEPYDGATVNAKILVFVNLGYYGKLDAKQGTIDLTTLNNDLNLNGFAILNVKNITGLNGLWSIDSYGNITAQSVTAQAVTVAGAASGVTVYDRGTTQPKCVYVENDIVKISTGACGTTLNSGAAAIIETASAATPSAAAIATSTVSSATSTESGLLQQNVNLGTGTATSTLTTSIATTTPIVSTVSTATPSIATSTP